MRSGANGSVTSDPLLAFARMPPLVSIILRYTTVRAILRDSVDSILAQRYRPIEVIVMDDASTDETSSIAAACGDATRYLPRT